MLAAPTSLTDSTTKTSLDVESLFVAASKAQKTLATSYPRWETLHPAPKNLATIGSKNQLASEITAEERLAIFEKLVLLFEKPKLLEDLEMRLYLEQQLSDLLGLTITSELDGHRLPHTMVKIQSRSHQPKVLDDQITHHANIYEAQMGQKRSSFGWSNQDELAEQFGLSLPLYLLKEWQTDYKKTWQWFKYRKVVLINPWKKLAAIAVITDIAPDYTQRYQALSNPELSRQTQLWFPGSQGRACLFLLENPEKLKAGLINC